MDKLHNEESEAAAAAAKEEFLREHPELKDITLKNDPVKGLKTGECRTGGIWP